MKTDEEILRDAAGLVRDNFRRGAYKDSEGRMCMVGAILVAGHAGDVEYTTYGSGGPLGSDGVFRICKLVNLHLPECGCRDIFPSDAVGMVYHYNDFHCTGGQEAAEILEKAATEA